tara:strand:+ start:1522 stop:1659 length:138 start_codon:yes stop_codon:yes gene_type:complete
MASRHPPQLFFNAFLDRSYAIRSNACGGRRFGKWSDEAKKGKENA